MTNLTTLLSEARERDKEPQLVGALEKLIADLSLLTPYDAAGRLQNRWCIRSQQGRPWKEPGEDDWLDIDGHRWACDGAIAFREDAPRPLWRRPLGQNHTDHFEECRDKAPEIREWLEQVLPPDEWQDPPVFSPRFAALLRECPATPSGLRFRMGVCRRGGEIIALVMTLRGCRGVGPDGLPVDAAPAVAKPAEEWTMADVKSLRRLTRKRKRQLDGSPTHLSDGEATELLELQQKRGRCIQ